MSNGGHFYLNDAAARHGVSVDFLRTRLRDGRLPYTRDERGWYLVADTDVAAQVASQHRRPTLDAAVEQLVAAAPALSDSQRSRLVGALQGVA